MYASCSIGAHPVKRSCANKTLLFADNARMPKQAPTESSEHKDFAERLEQALSRVLPKRAKPYSLQEKADALECSKSFMRDMLEGEKMPSAPRLAEIAVRTGVKVEWLWTGRGPMVEKITEGGFLYIEDLNPDQQEAVKLIVKSYKRE
jgi:hypothetical protein